MATSFVLIVVAGFGDELGRVIPLVEGSLVVGRTEGADIVLPNVTVSRRHARFTVAEGRVTVEDVASTSGTMVNEERVQGPVALAPGARVRVGQVVFELARAEEATGP